MTDHVPPEPVQIRAETQWNFARKHYEVLAEFRDTGIFGPGGKLSEVDPPRVRVLRNTKTGEIRVDVFGCTDDIRISYTNGGCDEVDKKTQKWYRDVYAKTDHSPVKIRLMGNSNMRICT